MDKKVFVVNRFHFSFTETFMDYYIANSKWFLVLG